MMPYVGSGLLSAPLTGFTPNACDARPPLHGGPERRTHLA
jgi:hypothetical protein